jgi:hypothetical protein
MDDQRLPPLPRGPEHIIDEIYKRLSERPLGEVLAEVAASDKGSAGSQFRAKPPAAPNGPPKKEKTPTPEPPFASPPDVDPATPPAGAQHENPRLAPPPKLHLLNGVRPPPISSGSSFMERSAAIAIHEASSPAAQWEPATGDPTTQHEPATAPQTPPIPQQSSPTESASQSSHRRISSREPRWVLWGWLSPPVLLLLSLGLVTDPGVREVFEAEPSPAPIAETKIQPVAPMQRSRSKSRWRWRNSRLPQ